jgi:hypothetical protein
VSNRHSASWIVLALVSTLCTTALPAQRRGSTAYRVDEITIPEIHGALKAGRLTCRALVDKYLRRRA